MIVTGKFLEVTEIRDVNFVRDGVQKQLVSFSYLIQWNISLGESGKQSSQEIVAEQLYEKGKEPTNLVVGKINDDALYDITIYFHASRTKDGRVFNAVRLYKFTPHVDSYGFQE